MSKAKKSPLNEKLDLILKNQETILENESKILGEEMKIEEMETRDLENDDRNYHTEEEVLQELDKLNKDFKLNVPKPLRKVTNRDLIKGFIGAFVGIMSHFAFTKGADIAPSLELWRVSVLYIVAFIIIIIMLYYTGFRKIEKTVLLRFLPARALILYLVSIISIIIVNFLFGKIPLPLDIIELYRLVGTNIILAVMGAGTADLIGRSE